MSFNTLSVGNSNSYNLYDYTIEQLMQLFSKTEEVKTKKLQQKSPLWKIVSYEDSLEEVQKNIKKVLEEKKWEKKIN